MRRQKHGNRIHPERWYLTFWTSYVMYQNTLSFLCFLFVCSLYFLISLHLAYFFPFFFVLNHNLVCDFCYRYVLSYIKVEQFKNNYMYVST